MTIDASHASRLAAAAIAIASLCACQNDSPPIHRSGRTANSTQPAVSSSTVPSASSLPSKGGASLDPKPSTEPATVVSSSQREPLGINLRQPTEYDRQQVFVDAIKSSRRFGSVANPEDRAAPVDSNGWPTSDFGVEVFQILPSAGGAYSLSFTGTASVAPRLSASGPVTIGPLSYDSIANRTTGIVTLTGSGGEDSMTLLFTHTNGGVRDLRLIRPGYPADTTQAFTNAFLDRMRHFSVIRDVLFSNALNSPLGEVWDKRARLTDAQQSTEKGVCYEYLIELANDLGKDIWICVPHKATDDFARSLADLLIKNLNSNLNIYIEYSNEVWNPMFAPYAYNLDQATAEGTGTANLLNDFRQQMDPQHWAYRRVVRRILQLSDIFATEFNGGINTRIRPVYSSQFGHLEGDDPYLDVDAMEWAQRNFGPLNRKLYGFAAAPYFGLTGSDRSTSSYSLEELLSKTATDLAAVIAQFGSDSNWDGHTTSGHYPPAPTFHTIAGYNHLHSVGYEGGPDISVDNPNGSVAAADSRMGSMVSQWLRAWYQNGNGLINYFNLVDNEYATFGLLADITQDTAKWQAVQGVYQDLLSGAIHTDPL